MNKYYLNLVLSVVICLAGCLDTLAIDYYVKSLGDDTKVGTSIANAWKSITKVNTIDFKAGDKVYFEGGSTFSGRIYCDVNDLGNSGSPIIFSSYGTGRATINGGTTEGFYAYNVAGIEIKNIDFIGAGATNSTTGISFYADVVGNIKYSYIRIDQVEVSGFKQGIMIGSWNQSTGFTDIRITNVNSHDNGAVGITSYAQNADAHTLMYIGNCNAYDNKGLAGQSGNTGSGIVLSGVKGATIENCIAYGNGGIGFGGVGIWAYGASDVIIQFCESYNNRTSGTTDGGGFDLDGSVSNSIMQYNYSHGNDGAGYLYAQYDGAKAEFGGTLKNCTIRYNISENDGRKNSYAGIIIWGATTTDIVENCDIYNNTIYVSPSTSGTPRGIYLNGANFLGIKVRNNIFIVKGGLDIIYDGNAPATSKILFQGNNYYAEDGNLKIRWGNTTYTSLASWRTAAGGQEKNGTASTGLSVDPKLTSPGTGGTIGNTALLDQLNAYKLQSASPMINAGLNLSILFANDTGARDYYGNTIPNGGSYDVGAHEYENLVTGIRKANNKFEGSITSIYPNPFSEEVTINMEDDLEKIFINIYSAEGKHVYRGIYRKDRPLGKNLPTGEYIIVLNNSSSVISRKIAKIK